MRDSKNGVFRPLMLAAVFGFLAIQGANESFWIDAARPSPPKGNLVTMVVYLFARLMVGIHDTIGQIPTVLLFTTLAAVNLILLGRAIFASSKVPAIRDPRDTADGKAS